MLNLTPSEKRTIFIISGVLILAGLFNVIGSYGENPLTIDYSKSDSIFSRLSHRNTPIKNISQNSDLETTSNNQGSTHKPRSSPKIEKESININSAGENELKKLPRIGPAMAKRIIEYRKTNGPLKSIDELMKVKGIGKKTFSMIKPYLRSIR
jgi:comEA protein